ncbi:MAG: Gfo/Idh/MocA family oxidoreductase [Planctomycetes bacterium]|nr:Gfo/Idh/MocA family oxidoreductase [Planctomycetota bacterium]
MGKTWQVSIIGPGWVAGAYCEAFRRRGDVRVRHVVGRTLARARAFAEAQGLDCRTHARIEPALADPEVDIAAILTPHNLHARQAIAAARAGKHIIIEKPVCLTLRDLRAMRAAVRRARVRTIVGFVLRWNPLVRIIRRSIDEGNLGDLIFAEVDYLHGIVGKPYTKPWHTTRREGGTSLLLAGCHAVDTLRYLIGKRAVEVSAVEAGRTEALAYPSTQIALIRFEDGTMGKVASCLESRMPYRFNIEVFGTRGTFRNQDLWTDALEGQTDFATVPTIAPDSADVTHHPFQGEVDHFIDSLAARRRPLPDIEDAAQTHEICFAAEMSARRRRAIRLPLRG